jgi:hypothetical protein
MNSFLFSLCSSIFLQVLCVCVTEFNCSIFLLFSDQETNVQTRDGGEVDLDNMSYEVGFRTGTACFRKISELTCFSRLH